MVDCCDFWTLKKDVKSNVCVGCVSINTTFDTSFLLERVPGTTDCNIWTLMYDGSICSEGWFENTFLYNCDGDTSFDIRVLSDIDIVIVKYVVHEDTPSEETVLANQNNIYFVPANTPTNNMGHNSEFHINHKIVPGTLDGEEIIESGETGTLQVEIQIIGAG